jgi:hypothetical protein
MIIKDFRQKIYYTQDQMVNDLFTNGGEFMLLRNFDEYVGFYHRYTTGEVFTENKWDPLKSERLIRFRSFTDSQKKYYDVKFFHKVSPSNPGIRRKNSFNEHEYYKYSSPRPTKRKLTTAEIDSGKTYRYFVTKRNERERVFFEISTDQARDYNDNYKGINQYLYEMISVPWKVDGPEYDIYQNNILVIPGVIDTNLRIVERFSRTYRLLPQVLTSPRELTVYENSARPINTNNESTIIQQTQPIEVGEVQEIYESEDSETPVDDDRDGGFGFTAKDFQNGNIL